MNIKDIPHKDGFIEQDKTFVPKEELCHDQTFLPLRYDSQMNAVKKIAKDDDMVSNANIINMKGFDRYNLPNEVTDRLGELLGLRKPQGRLQVLSPNEMTLMHVDNLDIGYFRPVESTIPRIPFTDEELEAFDNDKRYAVRFLIMLEDSVEGQGIIFKDEACISWKAGDVIYWDWVDIHHSTFNTSFWDRSLIRLSGIATEKTWEIINGMETVQETM